MVELDDEEDCEILGDNSPKKLSLEQKLLRQANEAHPLEKNLEDYSGGPQSKADIFKQRSGRISNNNQFNKIT